jgi:hypothetical protein
VGALNHTFLWCAATPLTVSANSSRIIRPDGATAPCCDCDCDCPRFTGWALIDMMKV